MKFRTVLSATTGLAALFSAGIAAADAMADLEAAAKAEGILASGPFAPDTVFMRARSTAEHPGEFDVVVAMYHDQGLIPVKYMGLAHGVNVTLGLPFVRTSPDHGTAFDIAGKGVANPLATILSAAMMLRFSLNQPQAADRIESAVRHVLAQGLRTADIYSTGTTRVGTREMGDAVVAAITHTPIKS